jgi:ATP-dependent phosphofructokinase / diphosphate-dependent phosphofructokinase
LKRNAIVAQSGGPSPVINSSLQGVIDACADYPQKIGKVLAAWHGVEGILNEELIDLGAQSREELALLRHTPATGAIGSCRYKLKEQHGEDFERLIRVIEAHDVGWFFYIGGNDSMDTAHKVSMLAKERGVDLVAVGVPKTIDNDVGDQEFKLIDHTPGYGSTARYWACLVQNLNEENRGMAPSEPVCVIQAMGRSSGWIPAAVRLGDPDRRMPLQIYLAEGGHTLESLGENVRREVSRSGRCIVVVSEGFDVGRLGEARDGFGHVEYGASRTTVAQVITNYLNEIGLPASGQATGQAPGVIQRSVSIQASTVDIEEAYQVGRKAVSVGVEDGTGWMATILRAPGAVYKAVYGKVPLQVVANAARQLPKSWISADRLDVTDDFVRYARPLIGDGWATPWMQGGIQRFARLRVEFVPKKLPAYTPLAYRKQGA